jgi:hypothetical protein
MNAYFDRMQELADDKTLLPRVRFMLQVWRFFSFCTARPFVAVALLPPSVHDIQDVIDLRASKWVPRRDNRMRTIGEIRKEVTDIRQMGFIFSLLATGAVQIKGSMIRILPC